MTYLADKVNGFAPEKKTPTALRPATSSYMIYYCKHSEPFNSRFLLSASERVAAE
jgi:hypothetical protein